MHLVLRIGLLLGGSQSPPDGAILLFVVRVRYGKELVWAPCWVSWCTWGVIIMLFVLFGAVRDRTKLLLFEIVLRIAIFAFAVFVLARFLAVSWLLLLLRLIIREVCSVCCHRVHRRRFSYAFRRHRNPLTPQSIHFIDVVCCASQDCECKKHERSQSSI